MRRLLSVLPAMVALSATATEGYDNVRRVYARMAE